MSIFPGTLKAAKLTGFYPHRGSVAPDLCRVPTIHLLSQGALPVLASPLPLRHGLLTSPLVCLRVFPPQPAPPWLLVAHRVYYKYRDGGHITSPFLTPIQVSNSLKGWLQFAKYCMAPVAS